MCLELVRRADLQAIALANSESLASDEDQAKCYVQRLEYERGFLQELKLSSPRVSEPRPRVLVFLIVLIVPLALAQILFSYL
eukprot:CAMPEP_0206511222 /NCGR_PEP_ID=MMETSP0324_2-20121206/60162_1 /ASSEMBLY_ACC=CAM_ASM_000836 /TAXON_ID=2866 /ORGANISM="Crypthecodinium cohnii, Strain Seligo" /LENGTH=81 /DNA_ID=CAMNT_0054002961 /DNA_START=350 /DNA_END=595 /DNA_ORIENTATION=-